MPYCRDVIPTAILSGLIVGRWWIIPLVALAWALLLLLTGTISASQVPEAASLAAVNTAAGVLVHKALAWPFHFARNRHKLKAG